MFFFCSVSESAEVSRVSREPWSIKAICYSELEPIIAEIEANGPAAMLKYVFFHSLETGIRFISVYGEGICFRY